MRLPFEDKMAVVVGATSGVDGGFLLYNAGSA